MGDDIFLLMKRYSMKSKQNQINKAIFIRAKQKTGNFVTVVEMFM